MKKIMVGILISALILIFIPTRKNDAIAAGEGQKRWVEEVDQSIQNIIMMAKNTGESRKPYQQNALKALDNVINAIKQEEGNQDYILGQIQDVYTQVQQDKGQTMALAMDLVDIINQNISWDMVFSSEGSCIMSYQMLGSPMTTITLPGTHNSYSNNKDAVERKFDGLHLNQGLSMKEQLEAGIRWLDLDLGPKDALGAAGVPIYFAHNNGTGGYVKLAEGLNGIKAFAMEHPEIVFIVEMSDVGTMAVIDAIGYANGKLREAMYSTGFYKYVYNMRPIEEKQDDESDILTAEEWINPKPKDMIRTGRNILFVPHERYFPKDRAYFQEVHKSGAIRPDYQATKIEERSTLTAIWDPAGLDGQSTDPLRFMSVELDPDDGALAGDPFFAARNNDGRRLYQNMQWYEKRMPSDKHIIYTKIDFFKSSLIGGKKEELPQYNLIQAVNTINQERFHFSVGDQYLIKFPEVDLIRNQRTVMGEVQQVMGYARDHQGQKAENSHAYGVVRADKRRRLKQGSATLQWWCGPEFALDGDYSTVWACDGTGAIWIDLGKEISFKELDIAWEYGMATPAYQVLGSQDGRGWELLYSKTDMVKDTNIGLEKVTLGSQSYRYIKLQTIRVDNEARTGIAELFLY